ncbi:hypothetical protein H310_08037 [Aphanomyces invadans]|uniref:Small ribosomal subunit protein mS33 n=1 Tax=Aphanomyces invadans TaxID=157072 RepID=A0A024TYS1_9STRA|nr:hypothetical protein H310_08037 [Aphanomyces invadans]ETV99305.1 hypothetical protein H310_08037 [Aphanomyces invadans]RHY31129.1 hypothetical protein DYB32_003735 [Aphanomyces invadans]|eukprot:XP_008871861.1 hypothetical protein H310_08037 [Aphanomyces invadans]
MSTTAKQLADLSRKIFERLPQNNIKSGNKIISAQLKGDKVVSWFNKPLVMGMGGYSEYYQKLNQYRLDTNATLKQQGRGPPKKGAGKRSQKKK